MAKNLLQILLVMDEAQFVVALASPAEQQS
jgi:hypothetical protein